MQPAGSITLPMSRRDLADYLGLTLETVSRTMSRLQSEGPLDCQAHDRSHCIAGQNSERLVRKQAGNECDAATHMGLRAQAIIPPGRKMTAATALPAVFGTLVSADASEVVALKVSDTDSQRMVIRVEQGKAARIAMSRFCMQIS